MKATVPDASSCLDRDIGAAIYDEAGGLVSAACPGLATIRARVGTEHFDALLREVVRRAAAAGTHEQALHRHETCALLHGAVTSVAGRALVLVVGRLSSACARKDRAVRRLTPCQREVAELAVSGLSNGQIARRTDRSAYPVAAHLTDVYGSWASRAGRSSRSASAEPYKRAGGPASACGGGRPRPPRGRPPR